MLGKNYGNWSERVGTGCVQGSWVRGPKGLSLCCGSPRPRPRRAPPPAVRPLAPREPGPAGAREVAARGPSRAGGSGPDGTGLEAAPRSQQPVAGVGAAASRPLLPRPAPESRESGNPTLWGARGAEAGAGTRAASLPAGGEDPYHSAVGDEPLLARGEENPHPGLGIDLQK